MRKKEKEKDERQKEKKKARESQIEETRKALIAVMRQPVTGRSLSIPNTNYFREAGRQLSVKQFALIWDAVNARYPDGPPELTYPDKLMFRLKNLKAGKEIKEYKKLRARKTKARIEKFRKALADAIRLSSHDLDIFQAAVGRLSMKDYEYLVHIVDDYHFYPD